MKLIFFIAFRYFISKKQNKYSTFTTILAILGITLGLTTLIITSNVMEGFKHQIKDKIVYNLSGYEDWDIIVNGDNNYFHSIMDKYRDHKDIKDLKIVYKKYQHSLVENEINQTIKSNVQILEDSKLLKKFNLKTKNIKGIIVPNNDFFSNSEYFLISTFEINNLNNFDFQEVFKIHYKYTDKNSENIIYIPESLLNDLNIPVDRKILIKLKDSLSFESSKWLINNINKEDYEKFHFKSWDENYSDLFDSIDFEELILKIITFMIIITSSFNIISTLVMIIHEKSTDIALMRTYGFKKSSISYIFITIGLLIGITSIIIGNLLGYLISININEIIKFIEYNMNISIIPNNFRNITEGYIIYPYYNYIKPLFFSGLILLITIASSLIPAMTAQKTDPAEELNNE